MQRNDNEPNFRKEFGSLYFYFGEKMAYGYLPNQELAFAFDAESGSLHKHGSLDFVEKWLAKTTKTFRDAGHNELADDLLLVSAPTEGELAWDTAIINKFVQNSGYIGLWYAEQLKILEGDQFSVLRGD